MDKKENRKGFLNRIKRFFLYLSRKYNSLQKDEIILGENKGLSVSFYKKPDFNWMQMREVRLGLEKDLDVSYYAKNNISVEQMEEIRLGLEKNLDVSFYNKENFDWMQMREIRLGLEKDLDVSYYAKSSMSVEQMEEIRLGLEKKLDVSFYNKKDFNWKQMREVRLGLEKDLDTSFYDETNLSWKQMREIRLGMEQGVNVYEYMSSENDGENMKKMRLNQLKDKFTKTNSRLSYVESKISDKKVEKSKVQNQNENLEEITSPSNKFNLSKFDVNMIFPEIKNNNTDEKIKSSLMKRYNSNREAEKNFNIYKNRIEKLTDNGYIELKDRQYRITQKAIEESKKVNKEFEFTSFDANKVFGYILKAGGELTLKDLEQQLKGEYTDENYINKQYEYLKRRLENNLEKGYVIKRENAYSISKSGIEKAREINLQGNQRVEDPLEKIESEQI